MVKMYKSNFESALVEAIDFLERAERGDICFTQGLRDILEASKRGEEIRIV